MTTTAGKIVVCASRCASGGVVPHLGYCLKVRKPTVGPDLRSYHLAPQMTEDISAMAFWKAAAAAPYSEGESSPITARPGP